MTQTAVEWLVKELESYGDPQICKITWEDLDSLASQAKEMEKENTINFAIQCMFGRTDIGSNLKNDFIKKYNENFKSE